MISQRTSIGFGTVGAVAATLMALLCLASFAPTAARAATGSISGTVTDASTAEPIEGVEVCAAPESEEGPTPCSFTETDGTYSIGGLDPGSYKVWFWAGQQYEFQYFDGKREWFEADSVEVLSGSDTPGIDAELEPTAAIEGTVTAADDGLGVEEVEVCAYPVDAAEENFVKCGETAADGTYTIAGLNPGSYQVEFWTGWTSRPFAYEFWNDESRYTEADVIDLAASERREGVDAELEPGAGISGNVSDLATGLPAEVRVCSIDSTIDKLTICTWTNEAGNYRIRSLPAGTYKVVFSPELWEFFPGEAFPGEEDDGYPTQFWSGQTTIAAANVLTLATGGSATGIDARFGKAVVLPPALTPPTQTPVRKQRRCRRGYKKKLVHGKRRCVKVHKHRRHRHEKHARPAQARFLSR